MPGANMPWRLSKKGLRCRGGKGQGHPPEGYAHRDLVSGRIPRRSEKHNHAALGEAWDPPFGSKGLVDQIGLHLWRNLPGTRQGRRARPAFLQHRNHGATSCRDIARHRAAGSCDRPNGSGWMAYNRQTQGARQHHIVPLPAKCPELNPVENICSSCATTGCRTASSHLTITSSITAARFGASSSTSHGAS